MEAERLLLRIYSGYYKPASGNVFITGENIDNFTVKEKARYIGYVLRHLMTLNSAVMI